MVLSTIILATVIGNVLVCVAVFLVKRLRKPWNYLLVSLAVSDLCVALLVMPTALIYEISGEWPYGPAMCDFWVSFDVLSCTASILNLCMIAVDRWVASVTRNFVGNWVLRLIESHEIELHHVIEESNLGLL